MEEVERSQRSCGRTGGGIPSFTGKEEDVEVGLQYFGKRFYAPLLGRWVSADPLEVHSPGEADGNLYAYVSGAVLRAIDPLGLEPGVDESSADAPSCQQYDSVSHDGAMASYDGAASSTEPDASSSSASGGAGGASASSGDGGAQGASAGPSPAGLPNARLGTPMEAAMGAGAGLMSVAVSDPSVKERIEAVAPGASEALTTPPNSVAGTVGYVAGPIIAGGGASRVKAPGGGAATGAESATASRGPTAGEKVYRVFGGDSKIDGASWSPIDPRTVPNYRNAAGLPSGGPSGATNTGRYLVEGTLNDPSKVVKTRAAVPLDGTTGGLTEYIIPKPFSTKAVQVTDVVELTPSL